MVIKKSTSSNENGWLMWTHMAHIWIIRKNIMGVRVTVMVRDSKHWPGISWILALLWNTTASPGVLPPKAQPSCSSSAAVSRGWDCISKMLVCAACDWPSYASDSCGVRTKSCLFPKPPSLFFLRHTHTKRERTSWRFAEIACFHCWGIHQLWLPIKELIVFQCDLFIF